MHSLNTNLESTPCGSQRGASSPRPGPWPRSTPRSPGPPWGLWGPPAPSILCSPKVTMATSSGINLYCTTGYCQRRPFQSSLLLLWSRAYIRHMIQRHLFGKNIHYSEVLMEHVFHILHFKDNNLLQGIGIFRVQPGILEVGLVKDTRELGEL